MTDILAHETAANEQAEQLRELQFLMALSRRVAALGSLEAALDTLLEAAIEETGADRGSIFLHDAETSELYTYRSTGLGTREIRLMDDQGVAGAVFQSGQGEIIADTYADPRFHRAADEQTGYETHSLICAPITSARGETIGVAEMLNKRDGEFGQRDLTQLGNMTSQCAVTLEALQRVERLSREREREVEFLNVVADLSAELELTTLLGRVVSEATRMLDCDRTTVFLNDDRTAELFSFVGDKLELEIRFPNHLGIAGTVFTSGKSIRIPHAYADLRFNPAFDRQSEYFTRSILCVPIFSKAGKAIGVTQSLNKRGGPFNRRGREPATRLHRADRDRSREREALLGRAGDAQLQREHAAEHVERRHHASTSKAWSQTCNAAGSRILRREEPDVVGKPPAEIFPESEWLIERIARAGDTGDSDLALDAELAVDGTTVSANISILPLRASDDSQLGTLVVIEDISNEKRVQARRCRATWIPTSRTGCSQRTPAASCSAAHEPRPRCSSATSAASHAGRASRRPGHGVAAQRLLRADGRVHLRRREACSTSSSATRSWRCSACPCRTTTTRIARCEPPSP